MSILQTRGGFPSPWRETVGVAGRVHQFPFYTSFLQVHADTNPVRLYFTEADFIADANYWEGFDYEGPAEIIRLWLRGVGGDSTVQAVAYQRRA